jgi:hypothetical protein
VNNTENIPDVVFLVTGQSNSQGWGGFYEHDHPKDQMDSGIFSWNIDERVWEIANMEKHMGTKPPYNQCFAFHFAKMYRNKYPKTKVGLIVSGLGGQSIARWTQHDSKIPVSKHDWKSDTGDLYDSSILCSKEALTTCKKKEIDAVLWHQGETDWDENSEYYKIRLRNMIVNYRIDIGTTDTPFIAGELIKAHPFTSKQNTVLRELNDLSDKNTRCAYTKNLEHAPGDFLHFNTESHREMGELYFDQYMITQYWKRIT